MESIAARLDSARNAPFVRAEDGLLGGARARAPVSFGHYGRVRKPSIRELQSSVARTTRSHSARLR